MNAGSRAPLSWFLPFVVFGVVARVWVLTSRLGRVDSDEAVVGLMAQRMAHGHFEAFYWGQHYGGTLETALVGAGFRVFGSSVVALKLV